MHSLEPIESEDEPGLAEKVQGLSLDQSTAVKRRELPIVNFLDCGDPKLADAIVQEALPGDRKRFRSYMENRFFGLGLVAAVSFLNSVFWRIYMDLTNP